MKGIRRHPTAVREMGFGAGMGLPNMKKNVDELTIESQVGRRYHGYPYGHMVLHKRQERRPWRKTNFYHALKIDNDRCIGCTALHDKSALRERSVSGMVRL